jgi:hypothetical protein
MVSGPPLWCASTRALCATLKERKPRYSNDQRQGELPHAKQWTIANVHLSYQLGIRAGRRLFGAVKGSYVRGCHRIYVRDTPLTSRL